MPQATWYASLADDSVHNVTYAHRYHRYPTYGGSGVVATELGQELRPGATRCIHYLCAPDSE